MSTLALGLRVYHVNDNAGFGTIIAKDKDRTLVKWDDGTIESHPHDEIEDAYDWIAELNEDWDELDPDYDDSGLWSDPCAELEPNPGNRNPAVSIYHN